MADILLGFTYSRTLNRYRDLTTGRFVAKSTVTELLEAQVSSAERRTGNLVTAAHEGRVTPGWFAATMRDELRRLSLQNAALGIGGMDRMRPQQFGRAGRSLRDDYARVARLAEDIRQGNVTLPQAMQRARGYIGSARIQYWEAERDALRASGRQYVERRRLGAAEHCPECIDFAAMGEQPLGVLPVPGVGSSCTTYCRCTLERREVRTQEAGLSILASS